MIDHPSCQENASRSDVMTVGCNVKCTVFSRNFVHGPDGKFCAILFRMRPHLTEKILPRDAGRERSQIVGLRDQPRASFARIDNHDIAQEPGKVECGGQTRRSPTDYNAIFHHRSLVPDDVIERVTLGQWSDGRHPPTSAALAVK
jgi:hypothetical protein